MRGREVAAARPALRGSREVEALCDTARREFLRGRTGPGMRAARRAVRLAAAARAPALEARAQFELGQGLVRFGRPLDAEEALERSAALCRKNRLEEQLRRTISILSLARIAAGDLPAARRLLLRVLEAMERAGDRLGLAVSLRNLIFVETLAGRLREAWRYAKRAHRLVATLGSPVPVALTLMTVGGLGAVRWRMSWGEKVLRRALDMVRGPELATARAPVLETLGWILDRAGRLDEARSHFKEAARIHARSRNAQPEAACRVGLAASAFRAGKLETARRGAETGRSTLLAFRQLDTAADASLLLVEVALAVGALDRAEAELRALARNLRAGNGFERSAALLALARARCLRLRGRGAAAATQLARARRAIPPLRNVEDRIALGLEEAAQDPDRPAAILAGCERRSRAAGLPWSLALILLARGAPGDLEEARSISATHGFRLLEADAVVRLAALADRAGRPEEAASLRARAALARASCRAGLPGGLDREPPPPAAATLSRAEKEVLKLLRLGLSNKEIGKRLFISPTTVRTHLSHVFSKLGVRSRVEAALIARAAP